jgi:hypothetical protein
MNRFRFAERQLAVQRGLESIYRVARDPHKFAEHSGDLISCFYSISTTSRSEWLRQTALAMGKERASRWVSSHRALPKDLDAETLMDYIWGCTAAEELGVACQELRQEIIRSASRFKVEEFMCFNPQQESPPDDAAEQCTCGAKNERIRKRCRLCKRKLIKLNRYEAGFYALTRTYASDSLGANIGARYADVIRWLPAMRPYRGYENGQNPDFYDTVYFVTHVVYTVNDYGVYKIPRRLLPEEFEFLKNNLHEAIAINDPEMVGEFLDSLKAFGLTERDPIIQTGSDYLLSSQNPDGSWGVYDRHDTYMQYHATWTAIDGLRDHAWRGIGFSFPDVEPLLRRTARKRPGNPNPVGTLEHSNQTAN